MVNRAVKRRENCEKCSDIMTHSARGVSVRGHWSKNGLRVIAWEVQLLDARTMRIVIVLGVQSVCGGVC